jgi:hypothetical protein
MVWTAPSCSRIPNLGKQILDEARLPKLSIHWKQEFPNLDKKWEIVDVGPVRYKFFLHLTVFVQLAFSKINISACTCTRSSQLHNNWRLSLWIMWLLESWKMQNGARNPCLLVSILDHVKSQGPVWPKPYPCFAYSLPLYHSPPFFRRCWLWPSCRQSISMPATRAPRASITTSFRRPLLQLSTHTNRCCSSLAIDKNKAYLVDPLPPPNLDSNWVVRHFSFVCSFEQAHQPFSPLTMFLVD